MHPPHTDDMGQTLGQVLEAARARHKDTQQNAADRMGTSQGNVHRWEADLAEPKAEHFEVLMRYLEVDLNTLGALRVRTALYRAQSRIRNG